MPVWDDFFWTKRELGSDVVQPMTNKSPSKTSLYVFMIRFMEVDSKVTISVGNWKRERVNNRLIFGK